MGKKQEFYICIKWGWLMLILALFGKSGPCMFNGSRFWNFGDYKCQVFISSSLKNYKSIFTENWQELRLCCLKNIEHVRCPWSDLDMTLVWPSIKLDITFNAFLGVFVDWQAKFFIFIKCSPFKQYWCKKPLIRD